LEGGEKMASEKILEQKKKEINELSEKLKSAKCVILTEYRGINVADITKMRADLRASKTEYKVLKNNIIKRALNQNGIAELDEVLIDPNALVINEEDYLEPAKVLYNYSKAHDFYKIKGGIIDGKVVSGKEIETLAQLPSREVLLAKLAGSLLGNITKLAVALNEVSKQKA
jgi:large subunit ribosomal protein L10